MHNIFNTIIIISIVFFFAIFIALYLYFTRNFNFWQKLGVPYVKPTPFVGNLKDCAFQKVNLGEQLKKIYDEHTDKPYVGIFSFDKPRLLISDLQLVKNVLVKDSQHFLDRIIRLNEKLDPVFSRSLFVIKGQRWRHLRTKLTPVYTSGKMKIMFYLVDTCGKELADYLNKATADGSPVDVTETMARYTTDVMASCAFGINGYSLKDPDSEFRQFLRKIFDFSIRKGLAGLTIFVAPALSSILKLKFLDDDTTDFLRKTVWSTVEYREKNGIKRNDFLDCMIDLRNRGKEDIHKSIQSANNATEDAAFEIDGDVFVAQAFTFLAAGFETSGSALSYALYELAKHPEIQQRLREEILQVMSKHDGKVTYNGIQEMVYLDMVVSETLRKYPIVSFLDRICSTNYELPSPTGNGTITLPAGTGVYITLLGLQNDPRYFPDPDKFDPDRFTDKNKRSQQKYTYIPFGEGPRICIGMRLGLMQTKTGLCHMLSRFEVAPCKDTPVRIAFNPKSFILTVKGEIPLSFKRT